VNRPPLEKLRRIAERGIHLDIPQAKDMAETIDYALGLEAQLKRNRQGLLNILEMRKLDSDKWGQRDGYGGRYGALTRQEIEDVIAQMDEALGTANAKPIAQSDPPEAIK
jgi:hypothetical protein